ncbi:MAG: Ig-like domain-containing protein, partial [Candidatus Binatia bacterium]
VVDRGNGQFLGCGVYWENTATYRYYPRRTSNYDECNLDKSGRWLVILDGQANLDNRIIDLQNDTETTILDQNGGLGHLDMGDGYAIGADNSNSMPQAFIVIDFPVTRTTKPVGPTVFYNSDWNTSLVNHVSHQNRKSGLMPQQQYACGSNLDSNSGRENEIVCFRMDGSYDALIVAPVMTNMNASGGGNSYAKYPKGNLDVTGQYFIWTSNMAGNRLDAFIVKVPSHRLVAGTSPPPPGPDTTPPAISAVSAPLITSSGATVTWTTNEASNSQIEYGTTTAYGSVTPLNGSMVTSHSQNLSGLAANTLYHYRVKSRDAAGNLATSPDATFGTLAGTAPPPPPPPPSSGDVTPPTVSITSPVAGRTVQGPFKVTASASDNVGVVGVQFKIDGQNLGTEDTVRPFARTWYTGGFTNGTHTITAVARDKAGNTTTSQAVTVTVKGGQSTSGPSPVTWTNLVNAVVSGNSLKENCGCYNAGAQSLQTISSGDGYFEFTASETTTQRSVGLSRGNTDNSRADIDFAIALWNGVVNGSKYVEVYENGVYKFGSVPYVTGDVFRVAVVSGGVKYSKNGVVFYTSGKAPSYPLVVDASLVGPQSTISNAVIVDN